MFLLTFGGNIGALKLCTNKTSPSKLYKSARIVSANNSETVDRKDLRLGKII